MRTRTTRCRVSSLRLAGIGFWITVAVELATTTMISRAQSFEEALDLPGHVWTTSGDAAWFGVFTNAALTHDGVDAAQSGPLTASSTIHFSRLETTVMGPGELTFWWRVEFELADGSLSFEIDHTYQASHEFTTGWHRLTLPVADGSHTLSWVFELGGGPGGPGNRAWLDQVSFVPDTTRPRLDIRREDSQLLLSWPVSYVGYQLERTTRLDPGEWTTMTLPILAVGNRHSVAIESNQAQGFFRLFSPSDGTILGR
jgi:hypothetical protein